MNVKKWCGFVIIAFFSLLILIGSIVIIIDPYFHYHTPIEGISYAIDNAEYMNDGISKHFDYNGMITGTSMTRCFQTEEAEALFDKKFVRITYLGEGFKIINDNLKVAIEANPNLDFIIRGVDPIWLVSDENWLGKDEYPNYLFDRNLWNDVNYLYNGEILVNNVFPTLIRTLKKEASKQFDDYVSDDRESSGKENVLKAYNRSEKTEKIVDPAETAQFFDMMNRNIDKNVISTIMDNPNITFYIFIPPYSICWWDSLNQYGVDVLKRRIDMEKATLEKLLEYENVRLFSFSNNFELTCNLDNYVDEAHYTSEVCSKILLWMKAEEFELTKENYNTYIDEITDFYSNYDYDQIFE